MIKKLLISENIYLQEDITAVKKYYPNISDDTFMELIALDPTYTGKDSVGKYGKWLLNLYNRGKLSEEQFKEIPALLNQFTTYRNRVQNKDLNSYKTIDDLAEILVSVVDDMSMLTPSQKTKFLKRVKSGKIQVDKSNDYDVVLETPNFIVYVPNTHEASMKLGKGTKWCTAHENPDWYNDYTEDGGKLYIIKDKKTDERWQYSDESEDFLDENDDEFDITEIMKQDEKLSKFFEKFLGIDFYSFDGTWIYDGKKISNDLKPYIENMTILDSVTSISECAFSGCTSLTSIIIPNSVTSIGEYAFRYCTSLESITIGNSVTSIGWGAFCNCKSLESITIPDSVTSIDPDVFWNCTNLTNISIPNSVTRIGKRAFEYCKALTSITIPGSVTSIDEFAFKGCESLTSITIPNSVTSIGRGEFVACDSITVYTDNGYAIDYCQENNIPVKPLKVKTESYKHFRLKIREY